MRRITVSAVTAVSLWAWWPGHAAGQDVSGSWTVTWGQAVRNNSDGTMEIQKWGHALLVLRQEGERVSGTWTTDVVGRVTWQVEGTLRDGRISLSASEHDSTDPQLAQVQEMRWRGTLAGNGLEGEMTLLFRGADRARGWRPWRARRGAPG